MLELFGSAVPQELPRSQVYDKVIQHTSTVWWHPDVTILELSLNGVSTIAWPYQSWQGPCHLERTSIS